MAKTPKNYGKSWTDQDINKLEKLTKGNTLSSLAGGTPDILKLDLV
jgi:hypothetical protein